MNKALLALLGVGAVIAAGIVASAESVDVGDSTKWSDAQASRTVLSALNSARISSEHDKDMAMARLELAEMAVFAYGGSYGLQAHKDLLEAYDAALLDYETLRAEHVLAEKAYNAADAESVAKAAAWMCSRAGADCSGK
jgi:hypothetical protein